MINHLKRVSWKKIYYIDTLKAITFSPFKINRIFKKDCIFVHKYNRFDEYNENHKYTTFFYFNHKTSTALMIGDILHIITLKTRQYGNDIQDERVSLVLNRTPSNNVGLNDKSIISKENIIRVDAPNLKIAKWAALKFFNMTYIKELKFFMENMYLL